MDSDVQASCMVVESVADEYLEHKRLVRHARGKHGIRFHDTTFCPPTGCSTLWEKGVIYIPLLGYSRFN